MRTVENLPLLVSDFEAARRQVAAEQLELHSVYNRHLNANDAADSIACIENDSIVYLEGIIDHAPVDGPLLADDVMEIGRYKRAHGKDETYYQIKQECIEFIDDYLENGVLLKNYDAFTATKYKLLLEKDCEVIIADYRHVRDPDRPEESDVLAEKIKLLVGEHQHNIFRSVDQDSDIDSHIKELEETVAREYELHDMREHAAVRRVLDDIARLSDNPSALAGVQRVESGKVKAYLCYGSAHMYSMTKKFTDTGVDVVNYNLMPLRNARYLDDSHDAHKANFPRTLALLAFSGITWAMIADPETEENDHLYYAVMDGLYDVFDGRLMDTIWASAVAARCLSLMRLYHDDPDASRDNYVQLLQEHGVNLAA